MYDLSQLDKFIRLRRVTQSRALREYNFTPNEVDVLLSLAEEPEYDTVSGISRRREISRSLVCRSVEDLAKRGYLIQEPDPVDHRYIHLKLSEKAAPAVQKLNEEQARLNQSFLKDIPETELNIFERVLAMMMKNACAD